MAEPINRPYPHRDPLGHRRESLWLRIRPYYLKLLAWLEQSGLDTWYKKYLGVFISSIKRWLGGNKWLRREWQAASDFVNKELWPELLQVYQDLLMLFRHGRKEMFTAVRKYRVAVVRKLGESYVLAGKWLKELPANFRKFCGNFGYYCAYYYKRAVYYWQTYVPHPIRREIQRGLAVATGAIVHLQKSYRQFIDKEWPDYYDRYLYDWVNVIKLQPEAGFITVLLLVFVVGFVISGWRWLDVRSVGSQVVFINNCEGSLGRALAGRLDKIGCQVIAGCNDPAVAGELTSASISGLKVISNRKQDLNNLEEEVNKLLNGKQFLALVSDETFLSESGPIEWLPDDAYASVIERNATCIADVTRVLMPVIRANKARIVNVISVAGRVAIPYLSAYSMAKFALQGFTDALRREVSDWGVHVAVVEPSLFRTSYRQLDAFPDEKRKLFKELKLEAQKWYGRVFLEQWIQNYVKLVNENAHNQLEPCMVAFMDALFSPYPELRYSIGRRRFRAVSLLPDMLSDWYIDHVLGRTTPAGS